MKFFAAVAAFVGSAAAHGYMTGTGVAYTTITTTAYETYCPEATEFEFNSKTYTVTEACTITITDCPDHACTYVQPIYTTTSVACSGGDCGSNGHGYHNSTSPMPTGSYTPSCSGSSCGGSTEEDEDTAVTAGSSKLVLSGAALAGVLALAAAL